VPGPAAMQGLFKKPIIGSREVPPNARALQQCRALF